MQMTWTNCFKCAGRGYHHDDFQGSYQCTQCEGVGKVEVPDLCPHGHPLDNPHAEPCYRKGCYVPPKEQPRRER